MQNEDLNRLKVILVEKKRTNKWLAEQLCSEESAFISNTTPRHTWAT